jgi:hypothetical protein
MEENCEKIWKIWKKSRLNSVWYEKYGRKVSWNVKWYGKCGRKTSRIVIRYGQYGRKASWIVKRYEKYGRKASRIVKIKVITKLPNSEQSYKGKVKTHNYINRQNQSTSGKLWKP